MNISPNSTDLVDFHSHILPLLDHGSSSLDTTSAQLTLAKKYGVTRIFATSHFYPHRHIPDEFLKKRAVAYETVKNDPRFSDMEIKLGAEILLCDNLHKLEGLKSLAIYGTDYLLIELPFFGFNDSMVYEVEKLIYMGFKVILAHADRYKPSDIDILISKGAEIQLNADSLSVFFKKTHLYKWINSGAVVGIGSDIHGKDEKAYKRFAKAKEKLGASIYEIAKKSDIIWNKALLF